MLNSNKRLYSGKKSVQKSYTCTILANINHLEYLLT